MCKIIVDEMPNACECPFADDRCICTFSNVYCTNQKERDEGNYKMEYCDYLITHSEFVKLKK